jgi:hypothetical protein
MAESPQATETPKKAQTVEALDQGLARERVEAVTLNQVPMLVCGGKSQFSQAREPMLCFIFGFRFRFCFVFFFFFPVSIASIFLNYYCFLFSGFIDLFGHAHQGLCCPQWISLPGRPASYRPVCCIRLSQYIQVNLAIRKAAPIRQ